MANGLFFDVPERFTTGLQGFGAALQEFDRPGSFAQFQAAQQQKQQQQALEQLGLGTPIQRAQRFNQVVQGLSGRPLQAGEFGPPAPRLTTDQQLGQLGLLTSVGVPGAQDAFKTLLQGQISPEEERAFGLQERGLGLRERQLQEDIKARRQSMALQQQKFNQRIREFNKKIESGGLEPTEVLNQQQKLRKEFTGLSGDFIKQRDAFGRVRASAENPSAAGDLALIFNYMKILDPGSVVRESEFATAQNAPGVPDRVRAQYNRVLEGERFTDKARKDFVDRADKLFLSAQNQHKKRVNQFTVLSNKAGLDPEAIVLDLSLAQQEAQEKIVEEQGETGIKFIGFE